MRSPNLLTRKTSMREYMDNFTVAIFNSGFYVDEDNYELLYTLQTCRNTKKKSQHSMISPPSVTTLRHPGTQHPFPSAELFLCGF